MKNYGIYQTFIRPNQNEPVRLLIAFTKAEDEGKAINNYTSNDFIRGYLDAQECSDSDYYKDELVTSISKNRAEIGGFIKLVEDKSKIDNIALQDKDDHPDYTNMYIDSADYDGVKMTEFELDEINEDSDFVHDQISDQK